MTLYVKNGGSFVSPTKVWVKTGGVWTEVQKVYVKSSGVWSEAFTNISFPTNITAIGDIETSPTSASASLTLNTNGTMSSTGNATNAGSNWFLPTTTGIGSSYWCRLNVAGVHPTGSTINNIVSMSSALSWTWTQSGTGTSSANCSIEIFSDSGGVTTVHTDSFNVNMEVTA